MSIALLIPSSSLLVLFLRISSTSQEYSPSGLHTSSSSLFLPTFTFSIRTLTSISASASSGKASLSLSIFYPAVPSFRYRTRPANGRMPEHSNETHENVRTQQGLARHLSRQALHVPRSSQLFDPRTLLKERNPITYEFLITRFYCQWCSDKTKSDALQWKQEFS